MTHEVKVPASGESITSASIARWHKRSGDPVARGEVLVTLETDKISTELEADAHGTLQILVVEGEEIPIGTTIALIEESAAQTSPAPTPTPPAPTAQTTPAPAEIAPPPPPAAPAATAAPAAAALIEVTVPAAGESITSANIARWHHKTGDTVRAGEVIVTLDTDKVSSELEAPAAGRLTLLAAEGDEVAIGAVIATLDPSAAGEIPAAAPAARPLA